MENDNYGEEKAALECFIGKLRLWGKGVLAADSGGENEALVNYIPLVWIGIGDDLYDAPARPVGRIHALRHRTPAQDERNSVHARNE